MKREPIETFGHKDRRELMKDGIDLDTLNLLSQFFKQTNQEKRDELVSTLKFEIAKKDFPNRMSWSDATAACEDLGEGWRLPTKDELNLMYINRVVIGGFATKIYWSSTEYDNLNARYCFFYNGSAYFSCKYSTYTVRAVRDIK